jgi:hypothetical protein
MTVHAQTPAGADVLTHGPIHEAFAEPVNRGVRLLVVPKRPPEAIAEIPPDVRPADPSAMWIYGHWSWDHDRPDFLPYNGVIVHAPRL